MLALFGAKDCEALEARLVRGEGPSARRLRHLAATLPIGESPRLEQIRVVVDRRPTGVNLRCVRIAGPAGASWLLLSVPALGVASDEPPAPAKEREAPQQDACRDARFGERAAASARRRRRIRASCGPSMRRGVLASRIPCSSRRLGPTRPIAASLSKLFSAASDWTGGDELIRVLGNRQTFSGVTVEWPLSGLDRRRLIALSAAPMFGRQREFLGYRGFGVLGEEIEAAPVSEGDCRRA